MGRQRRIKQSRVGNLTSMQHAPIVRLAIRTLLAEVEGALVAGPHPERARRDAEMLLLHALRNNAPSANLAWLIAHQNEMLTPNAISALHAMVERRRAGEPMQYIAGEAEFYGLSLCVNRDVLIPRPETEHLVEAVIEIAATFAEPRIVDIGTGSGAIAVTLAHELADAQIHGTDISAPALAVARANAERHGVAQRVRFYEGDLVAPVAGERFDIVVSNPPYVAERDRESLSVEVREYEPTQALFAGADGLAIYRRLIPAVFEALVPGGFVVLEIGFGQQAALGDLLAGAGFQQIEFTADLRNIPRVASARRP